MVFKLSEIRLTKLLPPYYDNRIVHRPRLLLPTGQKKIITVSAPAGYGKTVFLQQLGSHLDKPVLWYQLDECDSEPAIFLHYLVKGLQDHRPESGKKLLQAVRQPGWVERNHYYITTALANEMAGLKDGLFLVLDDYHELDAAGPVHTLIQEIASNLPDGIFLAVAGRTKPPLYLCQLDLSGITFYLGADELRFNRREISDLLASGGFHYSEHELDYIENITGGWPAAVRLAAGLRPGEAEQRITKKNETMKTVYTYLAAEIFNQQPEGVREFMLATSVFDVLEPHYCNMLVETNDAERILETLHDKHSLIIPLAGQERAYRYHQLLRDFLQVTLGGEKREQLLRRAAESCLEMGEIDRAVGYYLQAGFSERLVEVLKNAARQLLHRGHWLTVSRWLTQLTSEQLRLDPWLLLLKAKIELYHGRMEEGNTWAEEADAQFTVSKDSAGIGECLVIKAHLLRTTGRYKDSVELLERAYTLFPPEEIAERFDLPLEKAFGQMEAGRLNEAEITLTSALEQAKKSGNVFLIAHICEGLGNVLYLRGQHARALQTYEWAMRAMPEQVLPSFYIQDCLAYIYKEWGEIDKALEYARRNVTIKETAGMVESIPSAYSVLSFILFEIGDYEGVEDYCKRSIEMIAKYGGGQFFLHVNKMALAWCLACQGRWVEARKTVVESFRDMLQVEPGLILAVSEMVAGTVYAQMGDLQEAKPLLIHAVKMLEQYGYQSRLCDAYKSLAWLFYAENDRFQFDLYARRFLELASRINYLNSFLIPTADLLKPILLYGLENGVEVAFTQRILARLEQKALPLLLELTKHPAALVRERSIAPLLEIGGPQAQTALFTLAKDTTPRVSRAATAACAYIDMNRNGGGAVQEAAAPLVIKTLGVFQVFINGMEILKWRTTKSRDLLAYLAHLQEPVAREKLCDELWPEMEPARAAPLLRTTLYYLRGAMATDSRHFVRYRNDKYHLQRDVILTDYEQFDRLASSVLRSDVPGNEEIRRLEKAVLLYTGEYLEELEYTWVIPRQIRLRQLYLDSLLKLAQFYLNKKSHAQAVAHLLKATEIEPTHEQACRLLIQACCDMGNNKLASTHYRRLETILAEEMGIPPSPETIQLFSRLCKSKENNAI